MSATAVRVAHVPADHTYVEHATTPVLRPAPTGVPLPGLRWPEAPGWLRDNADDVDVVHAHFGFEQCSVDGLERVLLDLDRRGLPLVWTAHDLTNPHLVDQSVHEAQLALLARHAAGVVTLTDGAADEIARRWGRRAAVVPHPHLAPLGELQVARPGGTRTGAELPTDVPPTDVPPADVPPVGVRPAPVPPAVVTLPLGLLRPATDRRVVLALLDAFEALGPATRDAAGSVVRGSLAEAADGPVRLRVLLREETLREDFPRPDPELLARLQVAADAGRVDLQVSGRTTEAELWAGLRGTAALVLPYRWGSHSGWVEACHDVGTPVVAPALGHWAQQHAVHEFASGADGPDERGLLDALRDALAVGPRTDDVVEERLEERARVVAAHAELHARAAAGEQW